MKLFLGLAMVIAACLLLQIPAAAQHSILKVRVNFENPVYVGNDTQQVIPPGTNILEIVGDQTDRNVFHVKTPDGKNLSFTASAFDTRKNAQPTAGELPTKTQVILENVNGKNYLHRIWIHGVNRGFEFTLPQDVQSSVSDSTQVVLDAQATEPR
ncbi:MAG TPA: hypothetical protein VN577_21680 [Terriglobales bacterium]|nr:hypothetical protein [Terriglobales bacterium]